MRPSSQRVVVVVRLKVYIQTKTHSFKSAEGRYLKVGTRSLPLLTTMVTTVLSLKKKGTEEERNRGSKEGLLGYFSSIK